MKLAWLGLALAVGCSKSPPPQTPTKTESPGEERKPEELLKFQAPAAWGSQTPSNRLRKAQYSVPDKEKRQEDAEFTYSYFGPSGGGTLEENIDRWAAQLTGASRENASIEKATGVYPVTFVDLSGALGEKTGWRMSVAAVETPKGAHYFKLLGPEATVLGWASEFRALVLGAK